MFKRATNVTLHQYIIRRRVDKARDLLMETQMPIAEIAHECGFADQVHLTRFWENYWNKPCILQEKSSTIGSPKHTT
ncbi:helix-turn-helix transcriptional regulator [Ochrobactrum pseudogrignonense]|nr:helix-turn-helix transcriptional regulator [Brucella pseudogrignonensis]